MPFILNLLTTTAAIEQRLSSLTNPRDLSNAYSVLQEAEDALEKAVSLGPTRLPQHIAEELISDLKRISAAAESSSTRKQEQKVLKDAQDFRARVVTAIRKHQATEIYSPQSYDYLSMETSTERPGGKDFHPELEKVEDEQHKDITVVQESPLLSLLHGAGKAEGRSDCNDNVDGVRVGPLPGQWFNDPSSIQFKFNALFDSIPSTEWPGSVTAHVFAYDATNRYIYVEFSRPLNCHSFARNWAVMPPKGFDDVSVHTLVQE